MLPARALENKGCAAAIARAPACRPGPATALPSRSSRLSCSSSVPCPTACANDGRFAGVDLVAVPAQLPRDHDSHDALEVLGRAHAHHGLPERARDARHAARVLARVERLDAPVGGGRRGAVASAKTGASSGLLGGLARGEQVVVLAAPARRAADRSWREGLLGLRPRSCCGPRAAADGGGRAGCGRGAGASAAASRRRRLRSRAASPRGWRAARTARTPAGACRRR